jgi:hypothetical protein
MPILKFIIRTAAIAAVLLLLAPAGRIKSTSPR